MELKIEGEEISIPFAFDGDIMMLKLREPTQEEITTLGVVWIMPAMDKKSSQSIRRNIAEEELPATRVSTLEEDNEPVEVRTSPTQHAPKGLVKFGNDAGLKYWKSLLGFPSNEVIEKTLQATTQLCTEPVEMEKRELPRQHRKKRLHPLHPKRLRGQVHSDTFFSSIKPIRGYKYVQLFVHVPSDYIFI